VSSTEEEQQQAVDVNTTLAVVAVQVFKAFPSTKRFRIRLHSPWVLEAGRPNRAAVCFAEARRNPVADGEVRSSLSDGAVCDARGERGGCLVVVHIDSADTHAEPAHLHSLPCEDRADHSAGGFEQITCTHHNCFRRQYMAEISMVVVCMYTVIAGPYLNPARAAW
jgi:hypothetical protein